MALLRDIAHVLRTTWLILTFRPVRPKLTRLWPHYLAMGLLFTWLAGIGRHWDNPRAELWQMMGLGSLVYVYVLSGFLWITIAPLRPKNWRYMTVLVFVMLTSPPAFLYAVPVERFLSAEGARAANLTFLGIVALWRVVMLGFFLERSAGFGPFKLAVALHFPLTFVVWALAIFNPDHAVAFEIVRGMAGADRTAAAPTSADSAFAALRVMSVFALFAFPVLALAYAGIVVARVIAWARGR
ncbi:MAG: hypothetical protein HXY22_03075 [Alphaproteobacteria bacterium]|nr:hypothetical protein [Alphaproteobacteria bacterium]